jgi:hypothetical protein
MIAMKGLREFLKDTATGALILGSQSKLGLAGVLDLHAETGKSEEDRYMDHGPPGQIPTTTLKMVRTPSLNIGYEQTGPESMIGIGRSDSLHLAFWQG